MASVLRWAVAYWALAQVVIFCGALEDPVHIQLHLNGKETDKNEDKKKGLVKMWYDSQNAATPMYNDPSQRHLVEKAGLKKLYITGKFEVVTLNEDKYFLWDNKKKDAKALGEFILKIFKPGATVIVVFPHDLNTYTGFQFQKEFEEVVQNEGITVGRAVINVYLGLGDQNQEALDKEIQQQKKATEEEKDFKKNEKYYSIFAQYHPNKFSFRTVFTSWTSDLPAVNVYQVKIQEADSVLVKLMSVCTSDQNVLKVGLHTALDLATILLKLLRVEDVKTHPKQRIRVELPENCGTPEQRVAFTGQLVDNLQEKMKVYVKELKVYGKEPQVHIQVYINEMENDIKYTKEVYPEDIYINKDSKIEGQVNDEHCKSISSAKELFIHLHCHGSFSNNGGSACGENSKDLANYLYKVFETLLKNSKTDMRKTAKVKFHVCQAGSNNGQKYVNSFLTTFDELLHKHQITVEESLSFISTTSVIFQHILGAVPSEPNCGSNQLYWPKVHEKHVFGRFTTRTIKTTHGYKAFSVLPLTEYELIYNE